VIGPLTAVERVWLDPALWPSWVDGFGHVVRLDPGWPAPGSTLVWESPRGGRGRVVERVTVLTPGAGQRLEIEDAQLTGEQEVAFTPGPAGDVGVTLSLTYSLKRHGPIRAVVDALFIRRAMADALARTLDRFAIELAAELED